MPIQRKARKVRRADEFKPLSNWISAPNRSSGLYGWNLEAVLAARDLQMQGVFEMPVRLAERMRTDDALYVAWQNRLAPQQAIAVKVVPASGVRGGSIASEAEALFGRDGVGLPTPVLTHIHSDLANHGIAICKNTWTPRPDGSRVDVSVEPWPLEFVRWNESTKTLETRTAESSTVPINHADGTWTVVAKCVLAPWRFDAALIAAAAVFAGHAYGVRDWQRSSTSHGNTKVIGELPEGVRAQTQNDDGSYTLTADAEELLGLLRDIAELENPVGIRPPGGKVDILSNPSRMWEVFKEFLENREKAAARIYLGTDGTLGASGGAPGVDIQALFGVATTIVQGDLLAIERCIGEGVIEPWTAINFGDSSLAPARRYAIPDADADALHASFASRQAAFLAELKQYKELGFPLTPEFVESLADAHEVPVPPMPLTTAANSPATTSLRRSA